ncbi:helix-turn-helix domain-containing protein [Methylovorus glucosotrophus]|uniref:Transcriptional regulator, XRE family n=1 Tax=Methylovorus glucosotrophus (strain SIP3-4) TaxID=582744 RepID=C6XEL2_METGS|nr:helix-turn-helix transcriptional regulator [Methylovorus glucosotrophus]ACT52069.1 transcriptional regulator, XRE family [Methylovorus glucosotrophus SIP3-4]
MKNKRRSFGKILRQIRVQSGFTQEALGLESGIDRSYISLIERGESSPTLDTILQLCTALDISLSYLAAKYESEMQQE